MRFLNSLLVSGIVTASFGVSKAAPMRRIVPKGATNFTSKERGFSVWLPPGDPRPEYKVHTTKSGEKFSIYLVSGYESGIFYIVNASILPTGSKGRAPQYYFGRDEDFIRKNPDQKLRSVTPLRLGKYQGREFEFSKPTSLKLIRERRYFTPKSSYSLRASGTKADMQAQSA